MFAQIKNGATTYDLNYPPHLNNQLSKISPKIAAKYQRPN